MGGSPFNNLIVSKIHKRLIIRKYLSFDRLAMAFCCNSATERSFVLDSEVTGIRIACKLDWLENE